MSILQDYVRSRRELSFYVGVVITNAHIGFVVIRAHFYIFAIANRKYNCNTDTGFDVHGGVLFCFQYQRLDPFGGKNLVYLLISAYRVVSSVPFCLHYLRLQEQVLLCDVFFCIRDIFTCFEGPMRVVSSGSQRKTLIV